MPNAHIALPLNHNAAPAAGAVSGAPRVLLQLEGAGLALAAGIAFQMTGGSWWLFALLILAPDLFMLGYLVNTRIGAIVYNLGHMTLVPAALVGLGLLLSAPLAISVGLIWLAHIGMDRAVGYGFKYSQSFKSSHLSASAPQ